MDIMVTTPKKEMANAAKEAEEIKTNGGGSYFRYLGRSKPNAGEGDRVFYSENGFLTGFAVIKRFERKYQQTCSTTGRRWPDGWYVYMDALTWQWIEPIPYKGFQGWRYFNHDLFGPKLKIVGGYMDPKP